MTSKSVLKMAELKLTMMIILGVHPLAQHWKSLQEAILEDWKWAWRMILVSIFCPMNWTWGGRTAAKFMPKLLSNDQKQHCLDVFNELQEQVRNNPDVLSKAITCDRSWVYGYYAETKQASSRRPHHHCDQRKSTKSRASSNQCWLSSTLKGL